MMRDRLHLNAPLAMALSLCGALAGCAEPVADIDRTQGNLFRKSDLEGEWYLLQTVTDVPPTSGFTFVGETSKMERVRWEIREDVLVAFRSYPLVPGADAPAGPLDPTLRDNPVAAYPILAHVDVLREYNAATGEQTNVISENESDRRWWERSWIRVDWSASEITNFDFIAPVKSAVSVSYFVPQEEGGPEAVYTERDGDEALVYFDVTGSLFVEPDLYGCLYTWWGLAAEDCTSAEIKIRTAFARVPAQPTYDPFVYDDQLMSRFGYFRSERYTYDPQRGVVDAGRRYLIQRHDIWKAGLNDAGQPIPIPEREVRTVPYYLGPGFPDDDLLLEAAEASLRQWDVAAQRGVATALDRDPGAPIFALCHNPVRSGDDPACGAEGFAPRLGDLRYSTLHWVDPNTMDGLLGYGPSAADPLTGEIVSGRAYAYGAAIGTWASYALDMIRLYNQDLDLDTLIRGGHFSDDVRRRLEGLPSLKRAAPALDRVPIDRPLPHRKGAKRARRKPRLQRDRLRPYDPQQVAARLERARAAGLGPAAGRADLRAAAMIASGRPDRDSLSRPRDGWAPDPIELAARQARRRSARARGVDFSDLVEPNLAGIVQKYAGRKDYDRVWRELRAEIFAATAEHEVGHTLGLRHNFQGSYDSLNYFDSYWALREENLQPATSLGDVYRLGELTENQRAGQMRQLQYSSIMDYGYTWANDLQGLGKYDAAAIIFGYTAGAYRAPGEDCDDCVARQPGLIEVFAKDAQALGRAGELLTATEQGQTYDDPGLPAITLLEGHHYTTVALAFPSLDDLTAAGRRLVPYQTYLREKAIGAADRMVRVPYLFCSDEWEGALLSCHVFDQGADPLERVRYAIDKYRAQYPFISFRRDRIEFQVWYPFYDYLWGVFLPLSDVFQSWYFAPGGADDLYDTTFQIAIDSAFNLLAEVLTTPAYGTWCLSPEGRVVNIDDELPVQGQPPSSGLCAEGAQALVIEPGVGRRLFTAYDPGAGYYLLDKPTEAGHVWTTEAALLALFDPDAFLVGVAGDAGLFAVSFYDWYADEIDALVGNLMAEDYPAFAPRAVFDEADGVIELVRRPASRIYDRETDAFYDPETGAQLRDDGGSGSVGLCGGCRQSSDCAGYTGELGDVWCQPLEGALVCLIDCTEAGATCPEGTSCRQANCVPDAGRCDELQSACSPESPLGGCQEGSTCTAGACTPVPGWAPYIETEPTFSSKIDTLWWGMLLSTASYTTRFNDQLNVFRPGNDAEIELDPTRAERHQFTDPLRGVSYAANQPRCTPGAPSGGSTGLCDRCTADAECAGYTGALDGIYCQPIDESGDLYCLQDCTNRPDLCAADEACEGGNCVPLAGTCRRRMSPCGPSAPLGGCPEGETCDAGRCVSVFPISARCKYLGSRDTTAVRLIKRGQALSEAYERTLGAWYGYDGPDQALDSRLARAFFQAQWALTNHLDLLETTIAMYRIFGRIF